MNNTVTYIWDYNGFEVDISYLFNSFAISAYSGWQIHLKIDGDYEPDTICISR